MASSNPYDPRNPSTPSAIESRILTSYLLPPSSLPTFLPMSQFTTLFDRSSQNHPQIRFLYRHLQLQRNLDVETVRSNIEREVEKGATMRRQLLRRVTQELREGDGVEPHPVSNHRQSTSVVTGKRKRLEDQPIDRPSHVPDPEGPASDIAIDASMLENDTAPQLGNLPSHSASNYLTVPSLLLAMSRSVQDLEVEMSTYRRQAEEALAEAREIIGGLSDLRYGKFAGAAGRGWEDDQDDDDGQPHPQQQQQGVLGDVLEGLRRLIEICEVDRGKMTG